MFHIYMGFRCFSMIFLIRFLYKCSHSHLSEDFCRRSKHLKRVLKLEIRRLNVYSNIYTWNSEYKSMNNQHDGMLYWQRFVAMR